MSGHLDYKKKLPVILEMCGVSTHSSDLSDCIEVDEWVVVGGANNSTTDLISDISAIKVDGDTKHAHPPMSLPISVSLSKTTNCTYSNVSNGSELPSSTNNPVSPPTTSSHTDLHSVSDADSGFLSRSSSGCVLRSMATTPVLPSTSRHKALLDVTVDGMIPRPQHSVLDKDIYIVQTDYKVTETLSNAQKEQNSVR